MDVEVGFWIVLIEMVLQGFVDVFEGQVEFVGVFWFGEIEGLFDGVGKMVFVIDVLMDVVCLIGGIWGIDVMGGMVYCVVVVQCMVCSGFMLFLFDG